MTAEHHAARERHRRRSLEHGAVRQVRALQAPAGRRARRPQRRVAFARAVPARRRVLDVGCGFGDSTIKIAELVGPTGEAVGVDCAQRFIQTGEHDAAAAGVAQCEASSSPTCRTTTFAAPTTMPSRASAPCSSCRRSPRCGTSASALKPGGSFAQIVWRKREDNPWLHDAELRVREIVPVVSHEETDQVHCGPGPFSMSGPDMVSAMMKAAGFAANRVRALRRRHLHRPRPRRGRGVRDGARAGRRNHPARRQPRASG